MVRPVDCMVEGGAVPGSEIQRARVLRNTAQNFTCEAENLWHEILSASGPSESQAKVERLKEVQHEIRKVSAEFSSMLEWCPDLSLHVSQPFPSDDDSNEEVDESKVKMERRRSSDLSTECLVDIKGDVDKITSASLAGTAARFETVETGSPRLGDLERMFFEPLGNVAAPDEFHTNGVIICFHGVLSPSADTFQEWSSTANAARWIEFGATVSMPNLQVNSSLSVADMSKVVSAICENVGHDTVLLVGKDVVAIVHFQGSTTWVESIDNSLGVAATRLWCETGKHMFNEVCKNPEVAEVMANFFVSSVLVNELDSFMEGCENNERDERIECLLARLPNQVRSQIAQESLAADQGSRGRASISLSKWIINGMQTLNAQE